MNEFCQCDISKRGDFHWKNCMLPATYWREYTDHNGEKWAKYFCDKHAKQARRCVPPIELFKLRPFEGKK